MTSTSPPRRTRAGTRVWLAVFLGLVLAVLLSIPGAPRAAAVSPAPTGAVLTASDTAGGVADSDQPMCRKSQGYDHSAVVTLTERDRDRTAVAIAATVPPHLPRPSVVCGPPTGPPVPAPPSGVLAVLRI